MTSIEISGVRNDANKVGADKLLANDAGLGLSGGKAIIDNVLAGNSSRFDVADDQLAHSLVSTLRQLGFDASVQFK